MNREYHRPVTGSTLAPGKGKAMVCCSGKHEWERPEDAEKCCRPEWRRVALRDPETKTVLGRGWMKTREGGDNEPVH